ncbi:MAG TPA: family 43 glycosylhydrolase [Fibrobacteraceae bacterium]|nr:family 43 glycosylhydrolase [Fibrobacteraceae bacterium]
MRKTFFLLAVAVSAMASNPIVTSIYTADPAGLVYNDTVYIYTGHDEASSTDTDYVMNDWHVFSSGDMYNWTDHGEVMTLATFSWATYHAWAGQCIYRNGKFYWYVPMWTDDGFAIGVAVSSSPTGPFKDTLGEPLITNDMTSDLTYDIDPSVFIDDDGQAYLYWGNGGVAKAVKLKENMIELDGSLWDVTPTYFTEASYIHKKGDVYFLSYAAGWPERIDYATSTSAAGSFSHQGVINDTMADCNTNHQSIIKYHNQWFFIYHTGDIGGSYQRSVAIDRLYYSSDTTITQLVPTTEGVAQMDNTPLTEGVYRIQANHSSLFLEDSSGTVRQADSSASEIQQWILRPSTGNTHVYSLQNLSTGNYISFTNTLLDTVSTQSSETWLPIENLSVEDGYLIFADTVKDYVGDILNVSTEAGMPLITWKRTGTLNQAFYFTYQGEIPSSSSQASSSALASSSSWVSSSSGNSGSSSSTEESSSSSTTTRIAGQASADVAQGVWLRQRDGSLLHLADAIPGATIRLFDAHGRLLFSQEMDDHPLPIESFGRGPGLLVVQIQEPGNAQTMSRIVAIP